MRRTPKTSTVVLIVGLLAVGGAAFAFWTNSGSGAGAASTGTNVAVVVNQTSTGRSARLSRIPWSFCATSRTFCA